MYDGKFTNVKIAICILRQPTIYRDQLLSNSERHVCLVVFADYNFILSELTSHVSCFNANWVEGNQQRLLNLVFVLLNN